MNKRSKRYGWFKVFCRSESGSALVETALTLPLIVAMLLGSVELGDIAYKATEMSNAARAAAQYAAMNGGGGMTDCNGTFNGGTCTPTSGSGIVLAAQMDAPRAYATCTSFTVTATHACSCSSGNACATSTGNYTCASGSPVITVTVTTSAQCGGIAKYFSSSPFTLQGYAQEEVLP